MKFSKRKLWFFAGGIWTFLFLFVLLLGSINSNNLDHNDSKGDDFATGTNYKGEAISELNLAAKNICSLVDSVNVSIEEFASIQTNYQIRSSSINAEDKEQKEWDKASSELLKFYPSIDPYSSEAKNVLLSVEVFCPNSTEEKKYP